MIAILQGFFIDIGIVDAIDQQRAQRVVIRHFQCLIMLVAKAFEEIHVNDGSAGGHDAIDHVVAQQIGIEIHAAAGAGRTGDHQEDGAIGIGQHLVVDGGGAGQIAAGEAHLGHAVDDRAGVKALDVDMFDKRRQQLGLALALGGGELGNDVVQWFGHGLLPCSDVGPARERRPRPGESGAERGKRPPPAKAGA